MNLEIIGKGLELLKEVRPKLRLVAMAKRRVEAVLVVSDALFAVHRTRLADLEAKYRLPSMHGLKVHVEAGGTPILRAQPRGCLETRRVLRRQDPEGCQACRPARRAATKYDLVNLKTAKTIGLTFPPSLAVRADEVIK